MIASVDQTQVFIAIPVSVALAAIAVVSYWVKKRKRSGN